jgi:Nucleotidyltransferase domain
MSMDVATVLGTYLEIADSVAPGVVEGLYVVGSYALGDWCEGRSDIDIVAVTPEPATDEDYGSLRAVHALLSERHPIPHVDGPYLAWGDLPVAPATGLHRPWSLDGALHHDGECFEINPVTWYTLATYGVTVRGPDPARLGVWLDLNDRIRFVVDNLAGYWADVADDVAAASAAGREFDGGSFEWCALGALRLHYTAFTGDVTSKTGAGRYGLEVAPSGFHDVLQLAIERRASGSAEAIDPRTMAVAAELIEWVCADVAAAAR